MSVFRIVRHPPLSAADAWRRLTDWRRHGVHVPLTRVTVRPPGPTKPGTLVVARTAIGPFGFDDPMEVVRWSPPSDGGPGFCRLEKRGRVVTGWAELEVRQCSGRPCVVWREEVRVARLPRLFDAPAAWSGRLVFGRLVDALLADGTGGRTP